MRMLWLRFLRWYHFYNSGRRIVIIEGPGTVYFLAGEPMTGQTWIEIGYIEGGVTAHSD